MLHWPAGTKGKGALLTGDIIQVVQDRRYVSFMRSYPNLIPLGAGIHFDKFAAATALVAASCRPCPAAGESSAVSDCYEFVTNFIRGLASAETLITC